MRKHFVRINAAAFFLRSMTKNHNIYNHFCLMWIFTYNIVKRVNFIIKTGLDVCVSFFLFILHIRDKYSRNDWFFMISNVYRVMETCVYCSWDTGKCIILLYFDKCAFWMVRSWTRISWNYGSVRFSLFGIMVSKLFISILKIGFMIAFYDAVNVRWSN